MLTCHPVAAASLAPITAQLSLDEAHQLPGTSEFETLDSDEECCDPHHHCHHDDDEDHCYHHHHQHHHHESSDPHHASLDHSLHSLAPSSHAHLAPPVPPAGAISAATYDSIPSLYASIAELESCVLTLSRETAEAQGLQRQLAEQLENRPVPTT